MPPKKTKAAAVPSLQGCCIAIGTSSLPKGELTASTVPALRAAIASKDGVYVTKVSEATHLVVTEAQYNKPVAKVEEAKTNPGILIVNYEWLEKSLSSASPIDVSPYVHQSPAQSAPTTAQSTSTNGTTSSKTPNQIQDSTDTSKKRKRASNSDQDAPETKRITGNGKSMNVTKKLDMKVPLDEIFVARYGSQFTVHIDEDSVIYDVTLNQTDSGKNANKFYKMQLLKSAHGDWYTPTRWGRVGEPGQFKMVADGDSYDIALNEFKKKFKDKTGNSWEDRATGPMKKGKYVFLERSYDDSEEDEEDALPGAEKRKQDKSNSIKDEKEDEEVVESKLPEPIQRLLKLIFNQDNFQSVLESLDYDVRKMPLGKLSKSSLLRGYEVLKELASIVDPNADRSTVETLSNQYLSLIPHVVSRSQRPPVLDDMTKVKRELELLEALGDMQIANDMMKKSKQSKEEVNLLDQQYEKLGMQEMTAVDRGTTEFTELESYLINSVGHSHGTKYKVQDIFRIERRGEHDRFDNSEYAKVSNSDRRLLWHGSRTTNFGGILSQGLRIAPPEVSTTEMPMRLLLTASRLRSVVTCLEKASSKFPITDIGLFLRFTLCVTSFQSSELTIKQSCRYVQQVC